MVFMLLVTTHAFADVSGVYEKKNGEIKISEQPSGKIAFSLDSYAVFNANTGDVRLCQLKGVAQMSGDQKKAVAVLVDEYSNEKCVVTMDFKGKSLRISTDNCSSHCGAGAERSMPGVYRRK